MNPQQVKLVRESWAKLVPNAETIAELFYDRLFEIEPTLRDLFPDELRDQKRKLMAMLGVAVNGLDNLDEILPAVSDLGRSHTAYGVADAHYDVVGQALLFALSAGLGPEFSEDVEKAWTAAYLTLAGAMKEAAAEAAA